MKRVLPWFLAALSGLVLALSMPGPGLFPLVVLFPGLLLEAIDQGRGRWQPWCLGLFAGIVHWVIAVNWVVPVMHHYGGLPTPLAIGCLLGMAAMLGSLWALAAGITSLAPRSWMIWILPVAWISSQVLQRFPPFGFTWNGIASTMVGFPALMASLGVWGSAGFGWAILTIGASLWAMTRGTTRRRGVATLLAAVGSLLLAIVVSPNLHPSGKKVSVAVLQPGTSLEQKWDPAERGQIVDTVWSLTAEAAAGGASVVLWPESAVPFSIENDPVYRDAVEKLTANLGIEIVLNGVGPLPDGSYANSAYLVTPKGLSSVRYDKVHLVPFGEFVPRWARIAFTDSLVREVGAFIPGSEPVVIPASTPLGVAICFEVVFPDLIAAEVRDGAQILTTLTNDGWYGFSWAPHQHFAQVRLRAAEAGRWFARAALTGISGFVAPNGRVIDQLDVGEAGVLIQELQPFDTITPRARFGDWWTVLCVIATMVLVVASRRREAALKRSCAANSLMKKAG